MEKKVLRSVADDTCNAEQSYPYSPEVLGVVLSSLQEKGFIIETINRGSPNGILLPFGKAYLERYPGLRNPFNWKDAPSILLTVLTIASILIGWIRCR